MRTLSRNTVIILFFLLFGESGLAKSCFSDHISEAIKLNLKYKKIYSDMTDGKSDKVFSFLISSELLTYFPAKFYDFKARLINSDFCHEFKDMTFKTPSEELKVPATPFRIFAFDTKGVESAIQAKNVEKIKAESLHIINQMLEDPQYNCLTRHLFESIYRLAYFLPSRSLQAQSLSFSLLKHHLSSLNTSIRIDSMAGPLQELGYPILCEELPDLLSDLPSRN